MANESKDDLTPPITGNVSVDVELMSIEQARATRGGQSEDSK